MKNSLIFITMILVVQLVSAQTLKEREYVAFMTGSNAFWEKCVAISKEKHGKNSYEYAMTIYGMLGNTMASRDKNTFEKYDDIALDIFKKMSSEKPSWGEPKAIMSSIYGMIIGHTPMTGMFYGGKSSSLAEKALKLQPSSPIVNKIYGSSKLYTPSMFGGDIDLAIKHLKKSVELFEQEDVKNNWMYLGTLVELGIAYQKSGDTNNQKMIIQKALDIEPEFGWAKAFLPKTK